MPTYLVLAVYYVPSTQNTFFPLFKATFEVRFNQISLVKKKKKRWGRQVTLSPGSRSKETSRHSELADLGKKNTFGPLSFPALGPFITAHRNPGIRSPLKTTLFLMQTPYSQGKIRYRTGSTGCKYVFLKPRPSHLGYALILTKPRMSVRENNKGWFTSPPWAEARQQERRGASGGACTNGGKTQFRGTRYLHLQDIGRS